MANLANTASSARVLNLIYLNNFISRRLAGKKYTPFFNKPSLNQVIILKTRLRGSEFDLFSAHRFVATKIFVPYNVNNLSDGGKFLFVGQTDMEDILEDHLGLKFAEDDEAARQDLQILDALDTLPSLDPFLLKEKVFSLGREPHQGFFQISQREWETIRAFVIEEFEPLAKAAFGEKGDIKEKAALIADNVWEGNNREILKPILDVLKLDESAAPDILFSWKGIIYYKFNAKTMRSRLQKLIQGMQKLSVFNFRDVEERSALMEQRDVVLRKLAEEMVRTEQQLSDYEKSYKEDFIEKRDVSAFKTLLQEAPKRFTSIGSSIGAITHATSFWEFQYESNEIKTVTADEFGAILFNFSSGLGG